MKKNATATGADPQSRNRQCQADVRPAIDNPEEKPYPGYAREKAAIDRKIADSQRAAAVPLPGPLREAFTDGTRTVGDYVLLPVTLGMTAVLDQLDSPLLQILRILREEFAKPSEHQDNPASTDGAAAHQKQMAAANARILKEVKGGPLSNVETVYCFLTPPAKLRRLLGSNDEAGRLRFREAAMAELGDRLHPSELADLQQACARHYTDSFATIVQYNAKAPESGEDVFFSAPAAGTTTASAGGSSSSEP